ncbi:MAG TPA: oligosaccharide flippase family protein [Candidatus Magasanikbacteria bacterium]|nr:oligosaccharide flippase family protein [Candidatus Magasanikbacteria bacterium]
MNFTTIKQKIKKILLWSQKYTKTDMVYLFKNSFWTSIGKFFSTISGIIVLIFLTRYISKDIVGQYNFYLSILAIIAIFSIPGLNTSTIEAVAKNNDGVYKKAVKTSFKWSWFGSLVLILIAIYFYFIKNDQTLFLASLITAFLFPFLYTPNTWRSFLIGKQKFKQLNFLSSLQSILYLTAMILVIIFSHGNLIWIISVYLLIQIIANIFSYFFSQRYIQNNNENSDWKEYGFFLTKMQILNLLTSNLDSIMIGIFIDMKSLAIYSVGKKMITSLQGLIKEFSNIYLAKIAKREKINFKKYFYISILTFIFSIITIIFTPFIMRIFFPGYENSVIIAQLFLAFLAIWIFDLFLGYETSYNLKNKKIIFYKNIITPITYFILIIPALIFFQEIGLVLAVSFKNIINIIIFWKFYKN